jgi:hypothetical protein
VVPGAPACDDGTVPASAVALLTEARREQRAPHRPGSAPGLTGTARRVLELQRMAGNRAVAGAIASIQREEKDSKAGGVAPDVVTGADKAAPLRTTGFLGLNPGTEKEAKKLRKTTGENVVESANDPVVEERFKDSPALADFVFDDLGISVGDIARWEKAIDVLEKADPHIRDQLADVMRWFNKAERGEIILDRLVLSGHSNGVELWGESARGATSKPGLMIIERELGGIATVFPKAAAQVEDVMFSACFSINAVEIVKKVFPNLQTAWTYTAFSPNVKQGSPEHVAEFARATEGQGTLKKSNKRGTSALWTKEKGYIVGDPGLAEAGPLYSTALTKWREIAEPMYMGDAGDLTSPQLMPVYTAIQQMLSHPGTPADRKERGERVMKLVLRLRFWPLLRERFGAEHKAKLQPAYDAIGIAQPEWASMTRKALKAHVEAVKKALETKPEAKSHKDLLDKYLIKGLYELTDDQAIRPDWI